MTCNKDQNEQLSYVFGNIQLRSEGKMTAGDVNDFSGDESKPKFRYIPNYRTMDVFLDNRGVMIDDIAVKDNDITLWILDMKDNDISENNASRENIGQFRDVANMIDINRGFDLQIIDSKTAKEVPVDSFVILEQSEYLTMHLNTTTNNKKENNMKAEQKQKKQFTKKQIQEAIKHWKGVLKQMNESRLPGTVVVGDPSDINKEVSEDSDILVGNAKEFKEETSIADIVGDDNFGVYCLGYFIKCKSYDEMAEVVAELKRLQDEYDQMYS